MENATNILVAVDLGESSRAALVKARQLWDRSGAKLHVLGVVQDPFLLPWAPAADARVMTTLSTQMQQDAQAYLRSLLHPQSDQGARHDAAALREVLR